MLWVPDTRTGIAHAASTGSIPVVHNTQPPNHTHTPMGWGAEVGGVGADTLGEGRGKIMSYLISWCITPGITRPSGKGICVMLSNELRP